VYDSQPFSNKVCAFFVTEESGCINGDTPQFKNQLYSLFCKANFICSTNSSAFTLLSRKLSIYVDLFAAVKRLYNFHKLILPSSFLQKLMSL